MASGPKRLVTFIQEVVEEHRESGKYTYIQARLIPVSVGRDYFFPHVTIIKWDHRLKEAVIIYLGPFLWTCEAFSSRGGHGVECPTEKQT